MIYLKLR